MLLLLDLASREHLLDFFSPWLDLHNFFFQQIFAVQECFSLKLSEKNNGPSLIRLCYRFKKGK